MTGTCRLTGVVLLLAVAACSTTTTVVDDAPAGSTSGSITGAASSSEVAMPAGLSSEERFLWGTMTPEAQAQAAAYIRSGGTLTQFMAL
ncbi:hypothetical protein HMH01_00575 [Halovulum dunhuangense]|uniref:Uncharacterized protein n=1 Tax=Halovulum dunhuangense TaxID=1505036 RepID=A0A849KQ19_9RHOB|nr:hypothetical protein [Halovulum dunhuangense]NNU78919.1 hypothetical protein [Halovulum dunhuangense]